ncbi:MAG: hypothetical protein LBK68_01910 [Candidatus Margulisbacteria bacterium]|jgi:hypothetical protein|nr:hypothetical protein [Candidatus Margulisiibacteriota bacterium]
MLLQTKIISGFSNVMEAGLWSKKYTFNGVDITVLQLEPQKGFWLGSAIDPKFPQDVNSFNDTNTIAARIGHGIRVTDLSAISEYTNIVPLKILYVLGGTNLFFQKADVVFYQNKYYHKPIDPNSRWYNLPLCFFWQDRSGHFGINLLKPHSGKINFSSDLNIAASGRPVLLNGVKLDLYQPLTSNGFSPAEYFFLEDSRDARHLVKLPKVKDNSKERNKYFLGMEDFGENSELLIAAREGLPITIPYKKESFNTEDLYDGLQQCYSSERWQLDTERAEVHFPHGLDKNKYPHNVLAVDWSNNACLIQFHSKSGQEGVTIEELQDYLVKLNIKSAIVTSNGLDVFVYDVQRNKYFSHSRDLNNVLAKKDRPAQHLLFIYEN